jgi:hypothetical protein
MLTTTLDHLELAGAHRAAVHHTRQAVELWCVRDIEARRELAASLRAVLRQLEQDTDGHQTGEGVRYLLRRYEGLLRMHGGESVLDALIVLAGAGRRLRPAIVVT